MATSENNTAKIRAQRHEALGWLISGISSFVLLAITWQINIRIESVSPIFLTTLIILLSTSCALFIIRKRWIAIGIFCGLAVYIVLLPFLPPY